MERSEQLFIKGFNNGYMLAKHEPAILTALLKNIAPRTPYIHGIAHGELEYEQEITMDRLKILDEVKGKGNREKEI